MPDHSKTIKIDPSLFKVGGASSAKTKKDRGRKRKERPKPVIQPNKAKRRLLEKIKEHQKKQKELREQKKQTQTEDILQFQDELKQSMDYLQKIIQDNRKKRQHKRTQKNRGSQNGGKPNISISPHNAASTPSTAQPAERQSVSHPQLTVKAPTKNTHFSPVSPRSLQQIEINVEEAMKQPTVSLVSPTEKQAVQKEVFSQATSSIPTQATSTMHTVSPQRSVPKMSIKDAPAYGCLKNGKKPTYSQYMKTLKRERLQKLNISGGSGSSAVQQTVSLQDRSNILSRQRKLHAARLRSDTSKEEKKYKKFMRKVTRRTYKVGKRGRKVGVLLKNNKTRRRIKQEMDTLKKVPLVKMKQYLREKHLLKIGSSIPKYMIKDMFVNAILAGDVNNKNTDVMMHNYFKEGEGEHIR